MTTLVIFATNYIAGEFSVRPTPSTTDAILAARKLPCLRQLETAQRLPKPKSLRPREAGFFSLAAASGAPA